MNIANVYRNLKKILDDSNAVLIDKGLNKVKCISEIPTEIRKLSPINRLPYLLRMEIIEVNEEDFRDSTAVYGYVFSECTNLTSVAIPEGITKIESFAFNHCSNLKSITIPRSVESIDSTSFQQCNDYLNIYLNSTTPPTLNRRMPINSTATIHVPVGSGNAYKTATNWSSHANQIVEDIVIE